MAAQSKRADLTIGLGHELPAIADHVERQALAIGMLERLAQEPLAVWQEAVGDTHAGALLDLADPTQHGVELLELLSYAPPEFVSADQILGRLIQISATGTDLPALRAAERLLHALGQPTSAYLAERRRRAIQRRLKPSNDMNGADIPALTLPSLTVAIAGGHPSLRALIGRDLARDHIRVTTIPSATEATLRERDVADVARSADLIVIITRLIAHSTSDQVHRVGERLAIPVIHVHTASAQAVRRALLAWHQASLPSSRT